MKNKITMFMPPSVLANVANSNETDTDTILARLTSAGVSEYVPCMQCHGNSSYSGGSSNGGWNQDQQNNGKCQSQYFFKILYSTTYWLDVLNIIMNNIPKSLTVFNFIEQRCRRAMCDRLNRCFFSRPSNFNG